jgi:hypothetical protein
MISLVVELSFMPLTGTSEPLPLKPRPRGLGDHVIYPWS